MALSETDIQLIHNDTFETKLGSLSCSLSSNVIGSFPARSTPSDKGSRTVITTAGHFIEMYAFPLQTDWLAQADMSVESSHGWIWKITKINDVKEHLRIELKLNNADTGIIGSVQSGEFLDAITFENETQHLSLGTEDNEVMQIRARENDWMPARLEKALKIWEPGTPTFTNYTESGFESFVPELLENERIYFHFLAAGNSRKKSADYPDEDDGSTWYAVDQPKKNLLKWLNILD
jgi:hypothetical protein